VTTGTAGVTESKDVVCSSRGPVTVLSAVTISGPPIKISVILPAVKSADRGIGMTAAWRLSTMSSIVRTVGLVRNRYASERASVVQMRLLDIAGLSTIPNSNMGFPDWLPNFFNMCGCLNSTPNPTSCHNEKSPISDDFFQIYELIKIFHSHQSKHANEMKLTKSLTSAAAAAAGVSAISFRPLSQDSPIEHTRSEPSGYSQTSLCLSSNLVSKCTCGGRS
jgi:hypothetical protein